MTVVRLALDLPGALLKIPFVPNQLRAAMV